MDGDTNNRNKRFSALCAALGLLGAALIVLGARGELWFDEIWSLRLARSIPDVADVFTMRHDTNHLLNTLWLMVAGPSENRFLLRLPALFSGIGSLVLIDRIAARRGPWERFFAVALAATSYPLILYFSEARGYGPALFFTFAAIFALLRWEERPALSRAAAYWVCVVFGLLSHATFLMVYLALFLFSGNFAALESAPPKRKFWDFATLNGVPTIACGLFFFAFLKGMTVGGGTPSTAADAAPQLLLMLFGAPDAPLMRVFVFWPFLAGVAWSARAFYFKKRSEWLLFPLGLVVAPGVMTLFARNEFVYWRYYVLCAPFALLMFAFLLGKLASGWVRYGAPLAFALFALVTVGQAARVYPLIVYGRGDYEGALREIAAKSTREVATVTSQGDYQNIMLVQFHAENAGLAGKVRYLPFGEGGAASAEFLITRSFGEPRQPEVLPYIPDLGFLEYLSTHRYYGGISGWNLYLFRRR